MDPVDRALRERLLIAIPCFNEEENIAETVESVLKEIPRIDLDVQLLLLDDGSTDGTHDEMKRLAAQHGLEVRHSEKNQGVGRSLLDSYTSIPDGTWVTIMPGDNELDFGSIHPFLAMRESYDLILGYLQNPIIRPARRRFASWAFMRTIGVLYGFDFRYLNGMKLFRVEIFKDIEVESSSHAFNAELLAKAILRRPHLRIGQAPFVAFGRPHGSSKAIRPRSIIKAVYEVAMGWRSVVKYRNQMIQAPRGKSH